MSNSDDRSRAMVYIQKEMDARKPDQESPQGYQPHPDFQKHMGAFSDDVFKVFGDMMKAAKAIRAFNPTVSMPEAGNQKKLDDFKSGLETLLFAEKLLVIGKSKMNQDWQLANLDSGKNALGTGRSYTRQLTDEANLPANFAEIENRRRNGISFALSVQ